MSMYDANLPVPPVVEPAQQKQSKLGVIGFILSILAVVMFCIGFLIAFGYGATIAVQNPYADPAGLIDTSSPLLLLTSGLFCCSPGLSLVGVGLGIASVVQKTEKKVFGILGLVINGMILVSICLLFVIGLLGQGGIG